MMAALEAGFYLQAIIALGLVAALVVLSLQVRRLTRILPPAGALMLDGGPRPGSSVGSLPITMLDGTRRELGSGDAPQGQRLILFFSPTCPISKAMLSVARSYSKGIDVIFATDDDGFDHEAFAKAQGLPDARYCISESLGRSYGIGRVPQAVLLDEQGTVRARGLVNNREHLDSLINAATSNTPTLQDHLSAASA